MLDQSFSAKNFMKIFDYESRKGNNLENLFSLEIRRITKEIQEVNDDIKSLKKRKSSLNAIEFKKSKEEFYEKKSELKEEKETRLLDELDKIGESIVKANFGINLKEIDIGKSEKAYSYEKTPEAYFALKQTQRNIRKLYKVKQSNRYNIICQLREILSDKLPKYVIRTDISEFYESIPTDKLLKKLNDDSLLTFTSKKIIHKVLHEYGKISNNGSKKKGIPRGIGISPYLSELYLREFDEEILKSPDLLYYARYVDDIIIIYAANPQICISRKLASISKKIKNHGLKINKKKTCYKIIDGTYKEKIEYLGYQFLFGKGDVHISLTKSKVKKYIRRICLSFNDYEKKHINKEKRARSLLIQRIRFLTGNTRLVNSKKNVAVGIYFSSSLIDDDSSLNTLDRFLTRKIKTLKDGRLKEKLKKLSFYSGFHEKRFFSFSINDFESIVKVWKYAPKKN